MEQTEMIVYLSADEVAEELGKTRQWVHWATKNTPGFPQPAAKIRKYIGWDPKAIAKFKATMNKNESSNEEKIEK